MQLQKTKRLFQQYHYKIWLASVEPLCDSSEPIADVSYLLLIKSWLSTIVTWLFTFRKRESLRPGGLWLRCRD